MVRGQEAEGPPEPPAPRPLEIPPDLGDMQTSPGNQCNHAPAERPSQEALPAPALGLGCVHTLGTGP